MTEEKFPQPSPPKISEEDAAKARISELQARLACLQNEIRVAQGRLANRDPKMLETLRKQNLALSARLKLLEKALFALVDDGFKARNAEEESLQFEIFRRAAVAFCEKTQVDPEIWKNLVS